MKVPKILIIYLVIFFPIIILVLFTTSTGKACVSFRGFAVDREENLYLGNAAEIDVLNSQGKFIKNICVPTSRGYEFTITHENEILISTSDYLYYMDLNGNLIKKTRINDYADDPLVNKNRHHFKLDDNTEYIMKNEFLRTKIYRLEYGTEERNIRLIYQMPMFDYIIRLLLVLFVIGSFIIIPICVLQWRKILLKRD